MSDELPTPVCDWPMVDRVRWIVRQPVGEDVTIRRLVHLVREEKLQTAEVAASIHFHGRRT